VSGAEHRVEFRDLRNSEYEFIEEGGNPDRVFGDDVLRLNIRMHLELDHPASGFDSAKAANLAEWGGGWEQQLVYHLKGDFLESGGRWVLPGNCARVDQGLAVGGVEFLYLRVHAPGRVQRPNFAAVKGVKCF